MPTNPNFSNYPGAVGGTGIFRGYIGDYSEWAPPPERARGAGLRCRFSAIPGETPKEVLARALWLPAIFPPFTITEDADFNDFVTISHGEFSQPMGGDKNARKLRTVDQLDTLTLWWDAPWLVEHGLDQAKVQAELYAILHAKRPVQMLATTVLDGGDVIPEVHMDVTFRSVRRELRAAEPDARYFNIQIKEHRDLSVGRRGAGVGRKAGVRLPASPRLRDTDTLSSLSMEYYGTYSHWRLIRDANGISHRFGSHTVIVYNTRFKTGQKIKIPAKPKPSTPRATGGRPQ